MKIVAIGDPHGNLEKLKKIPLKGVDLILLTGDLGQANVAREFFFENKKREEKGLKPLEKDAKYQRTVWKEVNTSTITVLKYLSKFAPAYSILGNVGVSGTSDVKSAKKKYGVKVENAMQTIKKLSNVNLVKNKLKIVDNLRVGFLEYFIDTCWVKEFKPGNFERIMNNAKKETKKAQKVLDRFGKLGILVCHQPPYGFLDQVNFPGVPDSWKGKHAGSKAVLSYIKKQKPKYVFCGHIHEGEGHTKIGKSEVYNLGVCGYVVLEL